VGAAKAARRRVLRRLIALGVTSGLTAALFVAASPAVEASADQTAVTGSAAPAAVTAAAADPPPIEVTKTGPASTVAGSTVTYTLTASNPAGAGVVEQFNVSFRDVLPPGVSYVPGSTTPSDFDDPTAVTQADGSTVLVWENLFDLPPGASNSMSFSVTFDSSLYPVDSQFTDTATGYSSTDAQVPPEFDADGNLVPNADVTSSNPATATTEVTALQVTKNEPSPEGKLLRGVHDHSTVYTLTVTGGNTAATDDVVVTDYLPASLEFLGCGGVDNSTTGVEYPGAPPLSATPLVGANCLTPASVDTVSAPAGLPAGVYTQVTWDVGTLAAGQTLTIQYAAGVPLHANTLIFLGGKPTPASLGQAANLDNNIGPSTRQNGAAAAATNFVDVTGTYTGAVETGGSTAVDVTAQHTVSINDVRILKSVSPAEFQAGQIATYSLKVDTSEYVDGSDIVITDTVPNGLCPLGASNFTTGAPADCAPVAGELPSVPYQSVTQNADGTFTVVFDPISVAHNGTTTVTFPARMRTIYTGGSLAGRPTAEGDSFTNNVALTATTNPRTDTTTGESGAATVTDESSATQTSLHVTFNKEIQPRAVPQDCSANTYAPSDTLTAAQTTFQKGDQICFEITVDSPPFNSTVNPEVSDFLPANLTYVAGSETPGPDNSLPANQIVFSSSGTQLEWVLGAAQPDGTRIVGPDLVFQVRFAATVNAAAPGSSPASYQNLAKLQAQNSNGDVGAFRANAAFQVDPPPAVAIQKGVYTINGLPAGGNPPNVDHQQVVEGDQVVFRIDVSNPATSSVSVHSAQTWDVLPNGIRCADISAITPNDGVCTDPGSPDQPTFASASTNSAIVWNRPASEVIDPGASVTYFYTMTIPPGQSVSTDLVDTASVRSFEADTNVPGTTTYFPKNNVDTTVPAAEQDAPAASDPSDVFLPSVGVTKLVQSAINEPGNVGLEPPPGVASTQATIGEQVTYTVTVTLPSHATVYNGVLTDTMPTGVALVSASASGLPTGSSLTFDPTTATVTLPATFDNTSGAPVTFTVTILAQLTQAASNAAGVTRTNTATFTSNSLLGGGPVPPRTATSNVVIVEPKPALSKTANPANVVGGQVVTYTLTASNAASASVLHDAWVVDCLPAGLTFDAYLTPSQGTTVAAAPGAGTPCALGTTQLEWNVGDVNPGAAPTLAYMATVNPLATGLETFTNTATLTGDSLAGTRPGPTDPGNPAGRLYTVTASRTITVLGADVTKSADPTIDTIGQTVTYTVVGVLHEGVSYFNLTGVDTLPAGLDPTSVRLVSESCANKDGTACTLTPGTVLSSVPAGAATKVGLFFGNVIGSSQDRIITIMYSARVADVAAARAGVTLTNSVHLAWNNTFQPNPPANAGASFDQTSPDASAPITVVEPSMSITKTVDDSTVEPGQTFTYTLHVTNANTATTSAAHNVTVADTIPAGVVVDPASISDGGTLSGTDSNGAGGTVNWTLPGPIAPGAVTPLTYSATLGPSGTLTAAAQVNAAQVTGYDSLPSGGRHYPPSTIATAPVTPLFPLVQASKSTPLGDIAYVGEPFTWQITLQNTGGGTAYQVGAIDLLPPNWDYDNNSAEVSVAGGPAQQIDPLIDFRTGRLFWIDLAQLAPGASLTITYTATPTAAVATDPGVGLSVNQTNSVLPRAQDVTGATGNASGSYAGPAAAAVAHIAASDVAIAKDATVAPIAGGQPGQWTITVTNNGPDPAGGVQVTDGFNEPAPAGVTNIAATGTGWSCTGAPIICVRSDPSEAPLSAGASYPPITITYQVASDVAAGTVITNSATVTSHTFDTDLTNNTSNASTTVSTQADLEVAKDLTSPPVVAGQPASYAINVTNLGPSVSAGPFTITDTLPPGSTFVSAAGMGWACDPVAPGTVSAILTCTHSADLVVGDITADLVVEVGIPASQTADVVNTVHISDTTTPDPNPANDTATVTDTPQISADLQIQKRHLEPFVAGTNGEYTFTVANHGPSDAANATITDTLPAGLTYVSATSSDDWTCSASGQDVTCAHPTPLPNGSITTVTVTVHVASTVIGPIVNTATVSSTTDDPVPGNNTDSDNTDINLQADLAITKSHTETAVAGDSLDYTLDVANDGPSDVPATSTITVTDPLPAGLTYQSASGTGWACRYAPGTRLVTCTTPGPLAAGASAPDITLTVGVNPNVGPATIVNTADVDSDIFDPDLSNNHAEDPTQVTVDANIAIQKTLDTRPTPVLAGTQVTFTLQATNTGPSDAANVIVTDPLPAYLDYVSAAGPGWTCLAVGQTVICRRPALAAAPPGPVAPPITLTARVDPSIPFPSPNGTDTLQNIASIDMSSPGTVGPPSEADVPVVALANLALTKQSNNPTPLAGTSFIWTMTAHNNGPSDAAAPLTLTDMLPPYQTYLSAAPPWQCTAEPPPSAPTGQQTVTCTLASALAVGANAPRLRMLVQLSADAPAGEETNTALVSSPTPGFSGRGQANVTVGRDAKLTISKTHSGHGQVGQTIDFRIQVGNTGPATADQVVVTDPLPNGLTYVSATGQDWTCSAAGSVVTCQLSGTLAVGASAPPITLTAGVGPAAYPTVTNVANAFSTDPDLPSRASDSDPLVVDPTALLTLTKHHQGNFMVGQQGTYLLTVTNPGPTATPGPITITDQLPNGLTYVSAAGPGWTCNASGQTVTCVRPGELAVGAASSVTVTVLVGSAAVPSVLNTATATAPGTPPISASDTAPVPPLADASPASGGSVLSATGFDAVVFLIAALALIGAGGLLLGRARRRHPPT
jgi:large repetitive protein